MIADEEVESSDGGSSTNTTSFGGRLGENRPKGMDVHTMQDVLSIGHAQVISDGNTKVMEVDMTVTSIKLPNISLPVIDMASTEV